MPAVAARGNFGPAADVQQGLNGGRCEPLSAVDFDTALL
jgi:hypothetical protein